MYAPFKKNPILVADSYKLSHAKAYPHDITGMFSYGEPRIKGEQVTFFGLQMTIQKYLLTTKITKKNVDDAEAFAAKHGEPFVRGPWDTIVEKYDGLFPLKIRGLPEGTTVPSSLPLYSVEAYDEFAWLSSYVETWLQRGIWYPTTIASNDRKNRRLLQFFANATAPDGYDVSFSLHDFGGRGVSCGEQAEIGSMAHLIYFMGTDTMEGLEALEYYYGTKAGMAGFSVPATEHSIQCSYGKIRQEEYLDAVIEQYLKPGSIVSIVGDGYNIFNFVDMVCEPVRVEKIKASGGKLVIRPDSGDPLEIIPILLEKLAKAFGYTMVKGYKLLHGSIGLIQGDGIDYDSMKQILQLLADQGWSMANLVFGSGGGLLQKVNRDTYKFAQKATAIRHGKKVETHSWIPISKDPITDPGKKSKEGRVTTLRNKITGEYSVGYLDTGWGTDWEDAFVDYYFIDEGGINKKPGDPQRYARRESFDPIRERALAS
jgi:nicotinamide phosphoribosyltransferase